MLGRETELPGVYLLDCEPCNDLRGSFGRIFCAKEFGDAHLCSKLAQNSLSYNLKKGTLRGMHYQRPPFEEVKLVCCLLGKIYDVVADIRPGSPSFGCWMGVELNVEKLQILYIPQGFAHGFQTLSDDTLILYQISEFYHPECSSGFRYDDPFWGIDWPIDDPIISDHDKSLGFFAPG